jgi:pimeloyl-ACP methyl ester carboxylesterase
MTIHTLDIPDGRLSYLVRGTGPLLILVGAPMDAAPFAPLAGLMASAYTVVTPDPRGVAGSVLDDPEQDSTPELRAGDVVAIMDALGAESADVLGSSGGAVTGLALVALHPGRVRTLVAHEPPVLELLPDAAEQRAWVDETVETFHKEGPQAAFAKFMAGAGFKTDENDPAPPPPTESPEAAYAAARHFIVHEMQATTRYVPDLAALKAGPARVVVGIGAESGGLITYRTSTVLADLLGTPPVEFPGEHGGFTSHPEGFADVLRNVLKGSGG